MQDKTEALHAAAAAFAAGLTRKQRGDESVVIIRPGAPQWVQDTCLAAHGDMLPNDWRFRMIEHAADAFCDAPVGSDLGDVLHESADDFVPAYNGERTAWLASHLHRAFYCDDAAEEGLVSEDTGMFQRIAAGIYQEYMEVAAVVLDCLVEQTDAE